MRLGTRNGDILSLANKKPLGLARTEANSATRTLFWPQALSFTSATGAIDDIVIPIVLLGSDVLSS